MILIAFFFGLLACIPTYIPAVSNERMEMNQAEMQKRLDKLENVPGDIIALKLQLAEVKLEMENSRRWQDSMGEKLNIFLYGFVAFIFKMVIEKLFGGKIGGNGNAG